MVTSVLDGFAPIKLTDAIIPFATPLPAAVDGAGSAVLRPADRAGRNEPDAPPARLPLMARDPLAGVRELAGRGAARPRHGHRHRRAGGCCADGRVRSGGRGRLAGPDRAGAIGHARDARGNRGAAIATPLGIAIFTLAGPLQHGWARRAGTPAKLLAREHGGRCHARTPVSSSTAAPGPLDRAFSTSLAGTAPRAIRPAARSSSWRCGSAGARRARCGSGSGGAPLDGGGLSLTGQPGRRARRGDAVGDGGADRLAPGRPVPRAGHGPVGDGGQPAANLNIDQQTGAVTGTLWTGARTS